MATLTLDKILRDLAAAKFGDPITGAAVVMAESGGDTRAVNRSNADGSIDRGAWQINSKAHPQVTEAQAFDWRWSTEYAKSISKGGTDYGLWSATRRADFGKFKDQARSAAGKIAAGNSGSSLADMAGDVAGSVVTGGLGGAVLDKLLPGNPIASLTDALGALASLGIKLLGVLLDADFWKRLGLGLLGLALAIAGVMMLKPDLAAKVGGAAIGGPAGASIASAATAGA